MREIQPLVTPGLNWPPEALNQHRLTVPALVSGLGVLVPARSNWEKIGAKAGMFLQLPAASGSAGKEGAALSSRCCRTWLRQAYFQPGWLQAGRRAPGLGTEQAVTCGSGRSHKPRHTWCRGRFDPSFPFPLFLPAAEEEEEGAGGRCLPQGNSRVPTFLPFQPSGAAARLWPGLHPATRQVCSLPAVSQRVPQE